MNSGFDEEDPRAPVVSESEEGIGGRRLEILERRVRGRGLQLKRLKRLLSVLDSEEDFSPPSAPIGQGATPKSADGEAEPDSGRVTFAEAYAILSLRQKTFCDGLRAYAGEKSGAKEYPAKYCLTVGSGKKKVVKFTIRNGITVVGFPIIDERLRQIRSAAATDGTKIKVKETEIALTDELAYGAAQKMVDLRLTQLSEEILLQKQRAAERRKAKKGRI